MREMLDISVKGKYGLAAMVELAKRREQGPTQIRQIAEGQCIPQNFLEQVLVDLKRAGLLQSYRGANGGYMLLKAPADITVYDILSVLEGPIGVTQGHKGCSCIDGYLTKLGQALRDSLSESLEAVVLDQQKAEKVVNYAI